MDDIDDEPVPIPTKRPSVIRPDMNGPSLPARPAPPVPGGRPPPPIPSRLNDAAPVAPRRPPVSVPNRPNDLPPRPTSQSFRPANGPTSETPSRQTSQSVQLPEKPASTSAGSVRKRPEITIVCARPMSEVGFRSEQSPVSQPPSKTEKTPEVPGKQPPPNPRNVSPSPAQRTPSSENDLIDLKSDGILSTGFSHPTQKPSNTRLPPPKPAPIRGAPPVPKRLETELIDTQEDSNLLKTPPSPSRRTGPPPPAPRPNIPSESATEPVSKPPRMPPPRLPPETQVTQLPSNLPLVPNRNIDGERTQNELLTDSEEQNAPGVNSFDEQNTPSHIVIPTGEEYAVINKPKRPTIIRPGRPVVPKEPASTLEDDSKVPITNPPRHSPRLVRKEVNENSTETVIVSKDTNFKSEAVNSEDKIPEFLKLKLKSTTEETKTAGDIHSQNKGETVKVHKLPPPVLAPKPKPGILPKPQVSPKPKLNKTIDTSQNEVKNEIVRDKFDNSINIDGRSEVKNDEKTNSEQKPDPFVDLKPLVKRPTIIRPAKAQSVEKLNSTESQNTQQESERIEDSSFRQSLDDSNLRPTPRAQPPIPNKRPVSMINIPKSIEQDTSDMSFSKSMNFASGDIGDKPKPVPRPAARARPMSIAVPGLRKPLSDTNLEVKQPPRPQQRPPEPEVVKKVPLGVSVLPQPDKIASSNDKVTPAKPARRPPPPKIEGKDSSDDDTKTSPPGPPKPGRPSVRPPPPKVSPKLEQKDTDSSEEEFHSVAQEPPRPPPPSVKRSPDAEKPQRPDVGPPRKASIKETEQDDKDVSTVVTRPPKPESRPSRPLSTPGKSSSPPKNKPSRPGSMALKKTGIPELPGRPGPGHPLYHHMMKAAHGVAEHDYNALHEDELSFKTGEVIILLKSVDAEWIVGKVGEKEGMFPRSFVKVKIPLPGEEPDDNSDSSDADEMFYDTSSEKPDLIGHGPRCRARFDFDGEGPEDLVFEDGDVIKLLERVGPEWRKGELNGKVGLFPLSFVEVIEDLPADGATDETSKVVKAMFDYDGLGDELSFQRGDTITVQYKVNDEWLYGECGGRKGQFPVPFVDHMPADLPLFPSQESNEKDPFAHAEALWENHDTSTESEQDTSPPHPKSPIQSDTEMPYCVAIYDFPGETPDDLSFVVGDRIDLLEHVGADWLKGSLHGKTGMFPTAFVEIRKDLTGSDTMTQKESPKKLIYGVAQYDFKGETESELTFEAGTRLKILEKVDGAEDWQWGELNGHRGMFPVAFVQVES